LRVAPRLMARRKATYVGMRPILPDLALPGPVHSRAGDSDYRRQA
jgi:hypothetical protein